MYNTENIVSNRIPTSASNNNINNFKFFVSGGHEFASFEEGIRHSMATNYALMVRGEKYEGVRIAVLKDSNGYRLHLALIGADFSARISYDYPMGVRMTTKKINGDITRFVLNFLGEVENIDLIDSGYEYFNNYVNAMCEGYGEDEKYRLMDIMDEAIDYMETDTDYLMTEYVVNNLGYDMEDMDNSDWWNAHDYIMIGARRAYEDMNNEAEDWDTEKMDEIVASYQNEFDGYVSDLKAIAENYDHLTYGIDYLKVAKIVAKMRTLGEDLLTALGDYTNCEMCEEDGYWFDTTDFDLWVNHSICGTDTLHIDDLEDFFGEVMYMAMGEDRVAPMSEEDYEKYIDTYFMFEEWDEESGSEYNWTTAIARMVEDYVPTEDELDDMGYSFEYDYMTLAWDFAERAVNCYDKISVEG